MYVFKKPPKRWRRVVILAIKQLDAKELKHFLPLLLVMGKSKDESHN